MAAVLATIHSEPQAPIDKSTFWRGHTDACKKSKLTRAEYCRRHNVNYDQFGYWIGKFSKQSAASKALIPVTVQSDANARHSALASLRLTSGAVLQIHSAEALLLIIKQGA